MSVAARGRDLFRRALQRGVRRGEFRPFVDIEATAIVVAISTPDISTWTRRDTLASPGSSF